MSGGLVRLGWWARLFGRAQPRSARPGTAQPSTAARAAAVDAGQPEALDDDAEARLHAGLYALALHPALDGQAGCNLALMEATRQALLARDWSARQMPRRPQLLPQLIQTVNDPESSARTTAAIIGQDPVLTGNLLRIANSPAFRMQERPVDSLQRAIALVGTEGIRQIISAVLVQPVMHLHCDAFPQFSTIIWEHALLSSRAAADHARTVSQQDPFAAQWLGLTQGLGASLVMRQLLEEARALQVPLDYPTAEALLRHHTLQVAQQVAAAWELPPAVHAALLASHADSGLPRTLRFARAAAAASLLARHGHIGKSQALAWLEQVPGTPPHALLWIWRRLHGRAVETLADDPHDEAG